MHKRPDQYDVVHAKPVFAVGGTVSGYGSMGSAESLNNSGRDKQDEEFEDHIVPLATKGPLKSIFK